MRIGFRLLIILAAVTLLIGIASAARETKAPYVVGAFVSVSGPNAPLGTPERDTLVMMEEKVNKAGGINGHPLKMIIEDDGSDNTNAVKIAKKLIEQDKVCAIIGGSGTGPTLAVAPLTEAAGIPHISMAAGLAITQPVKQWVAPTDLLVAGKLMEYYSKHKIAKIAIIYDSNAFGVSGRDQLRAVAPKYKVTIVAEESFGSKDTDMTVQLTKIRASGAQAIICWGTNPGPAQVAKNVKQLGITIPLFMSHGVANQAFLDLAGPAANGVILPAVKLIIVNELSNSDPQKKVLLQYAADFQARFNRPADHYGGHAYDAFSIIAAALKKTGDDRIKLRDAIEKTNKFIGIGGVFNFSATDHDGLSNDACAMLRIENGKWTLLKK
jgi:branched-chain amino acid transport system substrate-binding protein